jgi:hypothetical protein
VSNLTKGLILVLVIVAIGVGLVIWKQKYAGHGSVSFNSVTKEEMELLLSDVAKTNPMILKRLKEDPELKKTQVENLKQLLAFASQAKKEGLADTPTNKQELESIRSEILAVNYDREVNKDKGPMPAFGFITEEQTKQYWESDPKREEQFNKFLDAKVEILRGSSPEMKDRQISDEERNQAREIFAKIQIYKDEYERKAKAGELPQDFVKKANLQVKLQQAQFLARQYSEKVADKIKVTDEEIQQYIASHPELDPAQKRAQAQTVLDRAKGGEDFAKLADEFSEDPGNQGPDGKKQGGIYKDVPKGRMVAPFETAALGLQAGQVAPDLIETDFGFHIIKLERALGPGGSKDREQRPGEEGGNDTYDVRHILFSTGYKDPENPMGREMPLKDYVRQKLETEKEKKFIEEIVAANNVQVAEDFEIPEVTDEQIQQMRQRSMPQMPEMQPGEEAEPPPPASKPEPKKN